MMKIFDAPVRVIVESGDELEDWRRLVNGRDAPLPTGTEVPFGFFPSSFSCASRMPVPFGVYVTLGVTAVSYAACSVRVMVRTEEAPSVTVPGEKDFAAEGPMMMRSSSEAVFV
jgi:hypothetical protein